MQTETALARVDTGALQLNPVYSVQQALERYRAFQEVVKEVLKEGTDYGTIPGAGEKKVLLKPGAEKLNTFFGLTTRLLCTKSVEDWDGSEHAGEPFFSYTYECHLFRGETLICSSDASCNSWESKYRYRKGERECPMCNQPTIIKGREEYGGGWLCFQKKGGCGSKFDFDDGRIQSQIVGRVKNPDPADQVNTIQKMAQKRALVGSCLIATNASDYFTQDLEDGDASDDGRESKDLRPKTDKHAQGKKPETKREAKTNGISSNVTMIAAETKKQIEAGLEVLKKTPQEIAESLEKMFSVKTLDELSEIQAGIYLKKITPLVTKVLQENQGKGTTNAPQSQDLGALDMSKPKEQAAEPANLTESGGKAKLKAIRDLARTKGVDVDAYSIRTYNVQLTATSAEQRDQILSHLKGL